MPKATITDHCGSRGSRFPWMMNACARFDIVGEDPCSNDCRCSQDFFAVCTKPAFSFTALHYEVVQVVSGSYDKKTIAINHTCPRELIASKGVENGKTYTYKLVPRRDNDYLLHDGKVIDLPFSDYRIVR